MAMRRAPASPLMTGAVRVRPRLSFQRARRWPFRSRISAPAGNGRVTVFLNTVPIALTYPSPGLPARNTPDFAPYSPFSVL